MVLRSQAGWNDFEERPKGYRRQLELLGRYCHLPEEGEALDVTVRLVVFEQKRDELVPVHLTQRLLGVAH